MTDNSNGHKPEFDFEDLSWGEGQDVELLQARIQKAAEEGDLQAIEASYSNIMDFLARVVVSVPEDWIVRKMRGQSIDWSNKDNYRLALRNDKAMPLLKALGEAQRPDEVTKN